MNKNLTRQGIKTDLNNISIGRIIGSEF